MPKTLQNRLYGAGSQNGSLVQSGVQKSKCTTTGTKCKTSRRVLWTSLAVNGWMKSFLGWEGFVPLGGRLLHSVGQTCSTPLTLALSMA